MQFITKLQERRMAKEESGFTLIELLVVLVIIGILLAIAVPSYLGFKQRAEKQAPASNVRSAIPAAEAYYSDNDSYTGMNLAALKSIDQGVSPDARPSRSTAGTYTRLHQGKCTATYTGPGGGEPAVTCDAVARS